MSRFLERQGDGEEEGAIFYEGDFNPKNPYKYPVAMLEMKEHIVRKKWINIETTKILREKLQWCNRIEGVNHLQKCCYLVQQYLDSTRGIGWGKDGRHPHLHRSPRMNRTNTLVKISRATE